MPWHGRTKLAMTFRRHRNLMDMKWFDNECSRGKSFEPSYCLLKLAFFQLYRSDKRGSYITAVHKSCVTITQSHRKQGVFSFLVISRLPLVSRQICMQFDCRSHLILPVTGLHESGLSHQVGGRSSLSCRYSRLSEDLCVHWATSRSPKLHSSHHRNSGAAFEQFIRRGIALALQSA